MPEFKPARTLRRSHLMFSFCRYALSLAFWLFAGVALAQGSETVTAFKESYSAYQTLIEQEKYKLALPHARRALELGEELYGTDHKNTGALTLNYGMSLLDVGDTAKAQEILRLAKQRYEKIYGAKALEMVEVLTAYGDSRAKLYDSRSQRRQYTRALSILAHHHGKNSIQLARANVKYGVKLANLSQSLEAKRFLVKGYEMLSQLLGTENPETGFAAFHLGKFALSTRKYATARDHFLEALGTFENPDAPSSQIELSTHAFLVDVFENLDDSDQATKHCLAIGRMTPFVQDQQPVPLFKRVPDYPSSAVNQRRSGWVIVEFEISETGTVKDPRVMESEGGDDFIPAAIAAAEKFRYAPRFENGSPVATPGILHKISFEIAE